MSSILSHLPIILAISTSVCSEALAVIQMLKYPTNSGVGGILAGILKVLQTFNSSSQS